MPAMDATRARLLEAAGEEFAQKGFDAATIRSICARADANIAAVNYHFGDKEQLYVQAVIEAHRCGVEMPPDSGETNGSPAERLERFVRHFLENIVAIDQTKGWHHALLARELLRPSLASETLVEEVIRPKFSRLIAILRDLDPALEGRRLNAAAFSIVGQCLYYRWGRQIATRLIGKAGYAELDVDFLTRHITQFSLAALRATTPASGRHSRTSRHERAAAAGGRS